METLTPQEHIKKILLEGSPADKLAIYQFDSNDSDEKVALKCKLFLRTELGRYFQDKAAEFHDGMILRTIKSYRGLNVAEIGYRGSAKTALKKIIRVFLLLNDKDHYRKYLKISCRDLANAKQIVTDLYNMCLELSYIYGNVFEAEAKKKEEKTMSSFVIFSTIKVRSGTVGQNQRGKLQDAYRPDWEWFEDIEDVESISSQPITQMVIAKCDEAINALAKGGSYELTSNYISEYGSVQWFLNKKNITKTITPIMNDLVLDGKRIVSGTPTWSRYTIEDIQKLVDDARDFWGEYMCDPNKSDNKFFDAQRLDRDIALATQPTRVSGLVKYWGEYKPHHRYGSGSDHSMGVGLDANTLGLFDFNTGELLVTYANNEIAPDLSAHEFSRVNSEFGNPMYAPEINNQCGGSVITTLKSLKYPKLFEQRAIEKWQEQPNGRLGWETNSGTKPIMFFDFKRDYADGLIKIWDVDVLKEMKSYTNLDLQEKSVGLLTRHFDLLTAVVIAWQMRKYAPHNPVPNTAPRPKKEAKKNMAR